ncbi:Osmotin, thaumatin-like protein [Gloeophyllum trabeum ATCC 11539]|uniref:Osmotin, thaumatin-like protein n=1 Tax=Gloeophyllum trabeum (strain ATCC 11539 / FP-39264 / Madison 617) TaxID=670483 RepID=S7QM32_GLOTA|nr:Osmotin, thaumatin-like protein [Gloeophyllum trabeum ATCC 11539]EPQ60498.1 Osmotin, thaumatin-like protein [Gloeophyllum trabeum ATCC 11539]
MFTQVSVLAVAAVAGAGVIRQIPATTVTLTNDCGYQVDPAFFPQVLEGSTSTGGFPLAAGASQTVTLPSDWSGRLWGRTGCNAAGVCATGSCPSGGENCTSPAPTGPTLAQFTINGYAGYDYFNPTSDDNFNIPLTIEPGTGCSIAPVGCTDANGDGNGCGATSACPTGTDYTIVFC